MNRPARIAPLLSLLVIATVAFDLAGCATGPRAVREDPALRGIAKPSEVRKAPAFGKEKVRIELLDETGTPVRALGIGSNLQVSLAGLQPGRMYDVVLESPDRRLVSWARQTATARGDIAPFILWYRTGVIGCSDGTEKLEGPFWFRSFAEAENSLRGAVMRLSVRDVRGSELGAVEVPMSSEGRRLPTLYAGDKTGCPLNSVRHRKDDVFAVGRNFPAGSIVEVYLVPARHHWADRAPLVDVRGPGGSRSVLKVKLGPDETDFVALLWKKSQNVLGSYDLVGRHYLPGEDHMEWDFLEAGDVVSFRSASCFVVQEVWGRDPHLSENIAGLCLHGDPYFNHVDGFARGSDVWGAIDPAKKPATHTGTYAAWYVVEHQDVWTDGDPLVDVTGGVEVTPVIPGCINNNWTLLWQDPSPAELGPDCPTKAYDVVIDFIDYRPGQTVTSPGSYTIDVDFIDRIDMPGFVLIDDPTATGPYPVGITESNRPCDWKLDKTVQWTNDFVTVPVEFRLLDPASPYEPCNNEGHADYDPVQTCRMISRVIYPRAAGSSEVASGGPFPLVLFLHGRQGFEIPGYRGYDYVMELLASHGFICVSIAGNDLLDANHVSRGAHIREFMRRMALRNQQGGPPIAGISFVGKVDLSRVVLVGHGDGGEAAVAAYELQRVDPDPAYSIGGIIALAPVQAIGHWGTVMDDDPPIIIRLKDVPYLILQGAKDGEVADFQGMRTYDRAEPFQAPGNTPLQMVYIKDANHSYFNTEWVDAYGQSINPEDRLPDVLTPQQQMAAAEIYIRAFCEAYVHGKKEYLNYFTGIIPPSVEPPIEVVTSYRPGAPDRLVLDNHEEINPAFRRSDRNSLGGTVTADHFGIPPAGEHPGLEFGEYRLLAELPVAPLIPSDPGHGSDQTESINDSFPHYTHGAVLGWWNTEDGIYSTEIPVSCNVGGTQYDDCRALVAEYNYLSFRIGQVYRETGNANGRTRWDPDFYVGVFDSDGDATWFIRVGNFATLPFPYPAKETGGADGPKSLMRTVRIPLAAFTANMTGVDLDKLEKIQFWFLIRPDMGELVLDDIEFVK